MTERNSKTSFTGEELKRIIALVKELEAADASKQKGIRSKIRKIGLYWSEVAPGMAYTVANVQKLCTDGTLKISGSEKYSVERSTPREKIEKKEIQPILHITLSAHNEIEQYKKEGFEGFIPVSILRDDTSVLPEGVGVYVVIRDSKTAPRFLEKGTGGLFKGKNPNVSIAELSDNYVADSQTVYIGKATSLRSRVRQLLRFGAGAAVGHWGGRYLWQLADSDDLLVAWKPTPGCVPEIIESQMIRDFVSLHGKRPFANLKD